MGLSILAAIQRFLSAGSAEAPDVKAELEAIKAAAPDTAPRVDRLLGALEDAVQPAHLIALGPEFLSAIGDIVHGHLKPKKGAADNI